MARQSFSAIGYDQLRCNGSSGPTDGFTWTAAHSASGSINAWGLYTAGSVAGAGHRLRRPGGSDRSAVQPVTGEPIAWADGSHAGRGGTWLWSHWYLHHPQRYSVPTTVAMANLDLLPGRSPRACRRANPTYSGQWNQRGQEHHRHIRSQAGSYTFLRHHCRCEVDSDRRPAALFVTVLQTLSTIIDSPRFGEFEPQSKRDPVVLRDRLRPPGAWLAAGNRASTRRRASGVGSIECPGLYIPRECRRVGHRSRRFGGSVVVAWSR